MELHAGGFLLKMKKRAYQTGIIDLTRGELSTRGNPELRGQETEVASRILNLNFRANLDMPDGFLEISPDFKSPIVTVMRQHRPAVVLAPHPNDRHIDHIKTSQLVTEAAFLAGVKKYQPDLPPHRPERVIYYHAHYPFTPSFIVDISNEIDQKIEAIMAYRSQFWPDYSTEKTFISSPEFLPRLKHEMAFWGQQIGCAYGEPFWMREKVRVDDPLSTFHLDEDPK